VFILSGSCHSGQAEDAAGDYEVDDADDVAEV
jgi:hypothetical protein